MNPGPARVLESLRRAGGRSCSGQALSAEQGVSRAQVWKHVQALRARGYRIDAEAGDGYRLLASPDRLYPEEILPGIETRWFARELHHFDEVDSTNRVAQELAQQGAPHGATVVAEAQTAGRGRLGRSFFSPPHQNLYSSSVLRPAVSIAEAPAFILGAAVAVAETLEEQQDDPSAVAIKWPNDVLLGGRKACGILMELGAEATRVAWLVLGIGVNLNVDAACFPEEFRASATSLSSHRGSRVDRVSFTRRLYENLEPILDSCEKEGFGGVLPRFEKRFQMAGSEVAVTSLDGSVRRGTVLGIDRDGALRLAPDGGGPEERVVAGDVTLSGGGRG